MAGKVRGYQNGIARVLQRVDSLHKQHRLFGNLGPGLGCVLAVVQPDAQNLRRDNGGEQLAHLHGVRCDHIVAVDIALNLANRAVGVFGAVVNPVVLVEKSNDLHE